MFAFRPIVLFAENALFGLLTYLCGMVLDNERFVLVKSLLQFRFGVLVKISVRIAFCSFLMPEVFLALFSKYWKQLLVTAVTKISASMPVFLRYAADMNGLSVFSSGKSVVVFVFFMDHMLQLGMVSTASNVLRLIYPCKE